MKSKTSACVVAASGVLILYAGWSSWAQEPSTVDKLKAKASEVGSSIKKGAASAGDAIKERYARTKDAVVAMGVEGRVYARLHWDKALTGSKIELTSPRSGVIALNGTVGDAKAKAKAVELAQETVGVTSVVDNLIVIVQTSTVGGGSPAAKP